MQYLRKKIFVRAPVLSQSGYGHDSRQILNILKDNENLFDIFIEPINWGQTSWLHEDTEWRKWVDDIVNKTFEYRQKGGQFDMSLQVTIPGEFAQFARENIGVTAGAETTKISPEWVEKTYMVNKLVVHSEFTKQAFDNSSYQVQHKDTGQVFNDFRCKTPISVIPFFVEKCQSPILLDLNLKTSFNFLTVAQWGPRKNFDNVVRWFLEEFCDNSDVGLVCKINLANNSITDRHFAQQRLEFLLKDFPNRKCKIYFLHGYLSEQEIAGLYKHPSMKAILSFSHGEGTNLPLLDAAANGLPIVATDWSGHLDFLYHKKKNKEGREKLKAYFSTVDYDLKQIQPEAVWNTVLQSDSMWAFPKNHHAKSRMREVYKDYSRFKSMADELSTIVLEKYSRDKIAKMWLDLLYPVPIDLDELNKVPEELKDNVIDIGKLLSENSNDGEDVVTFE